MPGWFSRWFGERKRGDNAGGGSNELPEVKWVNAEANPWGVPVLDVRPVTLSMLSTSRDPRMAQNAISYSNDDGAGFIGIEPEVRRAARAQLRYAIDRYLADGALFLPEQMEHKWAIFYHRRKIIFVRSWRRLVAATADVDLAGSEAMVTQVTGRFVADDEEPAFTVRVADFLIRTHAMKSLFPAPLRNPLSPADGGRAAGAAALWCFACFGNMAAYATSATVAAPPPPVPLRTHSLLHIAIARGNLEAARSQLDAGVPVDLLSQDGFTPLVWAMARPDFKAAEFLLGRGSPVDARSAEQATPLMNAVQEGRMEWVEFFLGRGADVNAADARGFTALHRAAEMGKIDLVRRLLQAGARPGIEAQGHTPLSLARGRGEAEIVGLLERALEGTGERG